MSNINEKEGKLTEVNVNSFKPDLIVKIPLKWRKVITDECFPVGEIDYYDYEQSTPPSFNPPFPTRGYEEWQEGGSADWHVEFKLSKISGCYESGHYPLHVAVRYTYEDPDTGSTIYVCRKYCTKRMYCIHRETFEIDMADLGKKLREAVDYEKYELIGVVWQSAYYKTDFSEWSEIITLEEIADVWKGYSSGEKKLFEFKAERVNIPFKEVEYDGMKFNVLSQIPTFQKSPPLKKGNFSCDMNPPGIWDWICTWHTGMPMEMTFLFKMKPLPSWAGVASEKDGDLDKTAKDDTNLRDDVQTGEGDDIDTTKGSEKEGKNTIRIGKSFEGTKEGTQIFNFDSIYLTSDSINQFIAKDGGIICDGGVFPNSDVIYVERITRSIYGGSMTVVQVSKFDATPKLSVGDKVFGYIKDKCVFCGYVLSINRRLTSSGEDIVYECVDLKQLLNQFVPVSYFKYRPPSKPNESTRSLRAVINELLIKSNITSFVNELPQTACPPCEFMGTDLSSILEWACQNAGNYVYYVNKNGKLHIVPFSRARGSKSYTIGVISDISVADFQPVEDMSLSRSKIVLIGDYEMEEVKQIYQLETPYFTKVNKEDMYEKNLAQGLYYWEVRYPGVIIQHPFAVLKPPGGYVFTSIGLTKSNLPEVRCLKIGTYLHPVEKEKLENFAPLCNVVYVNSEPDESRIVVDRIASPTVPLGVYLKHQRFMRVYLQVHYVRRSLYPVTMEVSFHDRVGGTEVVRDPRFKKIKTPDGVIDDTDLMRNYLNMLADYYKTKKGGRLTLDGLVYDLELLDEVTIKGAAQEFKGKVVEISFNIPNKTTDVHLESRKFLTVPYFDVSAHRKRKDNELLVKFGLLEASELYKSKD